jgi:2-phosphoglycerate kinase
MHPPFKVLLIGGCSSVGKSTLAANLAKRLGIPFIAVDDFWMALQRATDSASLPELHYFERAGVWRTDPRRLVAMYFEAATAVCRGIERVVAHHCLRAPPVILEGCWITPQFAAQSSFDGRAVASHVRAIFIHEGNEQALRDRLESDGNPPTEAPGLEQDNFVHMQWLFGQRVRTEAAAQGLPVVDARPFRTLEERALAALDLSPKRR